MHLERVSRVNTKVNAVIQLKAEETLAASGSPPDVGNDTSGNLSGVNQQSI